MFRNLLPRETNFFDYFERHITLTIQTCEALHAMMSSSGADIAKHSTRIKELECKADEIAHQCINAIHSTFITPFDRNDIHNLIKRQDDVVDSIDAAVHRMVLYEITEVRKEALEMAEVLVKSSRTLETAIKGLRNTKNAETIKKACIAVHDLEAQADHILCRALVALFQNEHDAIQVIKWKEIYERLEKATDSCKKVSNIIEGVLIEAS